MNAIEVTSPVCIDPLISSVDGIVNVGDSELPTTDLWGITADMAGIIYVVESEFYDSAGNLYTRILKYDASGILVAVSAIDNVSGSTYPAFTAPNNGFNQSIGIV